jgi:hemolysin activation/secretion protein
MAAAPARAQTATPAPVPHFMIRAFQVKGNHLIAPREVEDAVYPFMGPDKTPADVEHARAALQTVFEKKGFATASVSIPEQSVDSGIIQLEVQVQTIGRVAVVGGGKGAAAWVRRRAPSLTPGTAPNFQAVQQDIVTLNSSPDRKVTPDVKAGVAPGTVDVTLNVQETIPVHGSLEFNNDDSPETTPYRVLGTLRYDDLWGRGDSISVSAQTAPERPNDATVFSGNYLAHLGKVQGLFYYVHSDSDVAVVGGTTVVGKGDLAGFRLIIPISQSDGFYQSITAGFDYKNFGENVRLGADTSTAPVTYYPVNVSWRGDWTGKTAKADLSISTTFGTRGLGSSAEAFDNKRFDAKPDFFLVKLEGSRTQDLSSGFQLWGHVTSQYSQDPLISNEEFSLGGLTTVRGYFESEVLGDYGLATQAEIRTPNLGALAPSWKVNAFRLHLFADGGYAGIQDPLAGQTRDNWLGSAGAGAALTIMDHINGAVDVGTPLVDGPDKKTGTVFGRFRIWGDF